MLLGQVYKTDNNMLGLRYTSTLWWTRSIPGFFCPTIYVEQYMCKSYEIGDEVGMIPMKSE